MRYHASETLEIIRLVERSHLPVKRTLDMLDTPRTTFYRSYDRHLSLGEAGLVDRLSRPSWVWNRIPDAVRRQIVDLALDEPELSPGSWPCGSPTPSVTSSPKPVFTGF